MSNVYRDSVIDECIKAVEGAFDEHEKSNEAQGLLHAVEVLETLKTPEKAGGKPVSNSSTIEAIGYEPAMQLLKVKFKSGGTYHFEGVPSAEYQKLITAESVGRYFHKHIKGAFKPEKQEEKAMSDYKSDASASHTAKLSRYAGGGEVAPRSIRYGWSRDTDAKTGVTTATPSWGKPKADDSKKDDQR